VQRHEEIQRYRGYVDAKVSRTESTLISITPDPDRDPHLAVCYFLAESDNNSIQNFRSDVARFQHWEKVYVQACPPKIQINIYIRRWKHGRLQRYISKPFPITMSHGS
jgi:hypothetical protein